MGDRSGRNTISAQLVQRTYKQWVRDLSQVIISPLLKSFLGFDKLNFPPGDYKAPYAADVTRGVNSLYVYCPLIEPNFQTVEIDIRDDTGVKYHSSEDAWW